MSERQPVADAEPDYRFTLANERTYLAYIRTALALNAAGLAAYQFLDPHGEHLRLFLASLLIVSAAGLAALGYRRWAQVDRAMRSHGVLPKVRLPVFVAIGMVTVSLVALAIVLSEH